MQHSYLIGLLNLSSTRVFLDLSKFGIGLGRVYIKLSPATALARQFLLLCTGQRGPSFIGSRFLMVNDLGQRWEWVSAGDYDKDTGEGGATLVQEVKGEPEYWRSDTEGLVWATHGSTRSKSAQFAITTGNSPTGTRSWAFGQVDGGLGVVRAEVNAINIGKVTIDNCGLVVPL